MLGSNLSNVFLLTPGDIGIINLPNKKKLRKYLQQFLMVNIKILFFYSALGIL